MSEDLPQLAIAYGERSVSLLALAQAARGLCRLVVVLDTGKPNGILLARLARKVGTVVDVAGRDDTTVVTALRELNVAGLVTYFDTDMVRLARIAGALGLRFHTEEVARALTDKTEQRRRIAAAGLPGPTTTSIPADEDPRKAAARLTYPSVLKPRHGDGSRHTYRLDGPDDAHRFLAGMSPREPMVAEHMLVARDRGPFAGYVSVESFVRSGVASHLIVTGRFPPAEHFRETGFFVPAAVTDEVHADLLAETDRVLAAVGVREGACHTEFMLTGDGPRLIEVNGRLGGGIPDIVALAGGPQLHPAAMRWALGLPLGFETPLELHAVGYRFLVQPPAGVHRVVSYHDLDALSGSPGIADVSVHHEPGTVIDSREGSRSYVLDVTGTAPDHGSLLKASAHVTDPSWISYEPATR